MQHLRKEHSKLTPTFEIVPNYTIWEDNIGTTSLRTFSSAPQNASRRLHPSFKLVLVSRRIDSKNSSSLYFLNFQDPIGEVEGAKDTLSMCFSSKRPEEVSSHWCCSKHSIRSRLRLQLLHCTHWTGHPTPWNFGSMQQKTCRLVSYKATAYLILSDPICMVIMLTKALFCSRLMWGSWNFTRYFRPKIACVVFLLTGQTCVYGPWQKLGSQSMTSWQQPIETLPVFQSFAISRLL